MAGRRAALESNPELHRFLLQNVRPTGRTLGVGSYGSVEEVMALSGLLCAGKKIHEVLVNQGVQIVARKYVAECQLMSELRHPNIVQFLGLCFLEDSTLPVLVMEKLVTSLDEILENTPNIPLGVKKSILMDVARGLIYLHSREPRPIIHRDLTAKNILLNSSLNAKISDLGNSRIVDSQPRQVAHTMSAAPGTTVYMPPEALEETARYGPSLDIFSFGHLSLFTLSQVFPGNLLRHTYPDPNNQRRLIARSEVERRQAYFTRLYQQLGERHPLVQLVERCLDNDSEYRPSAVAVLQQLEAVEVEDPYQHLTKLDMIRLLQQGIDPQREEEIQRLQSQLQQMQLYVAESRTQRDRIIGDKDEIIQERNERIRGMDAEIQRLQTDMTDKDRAVREKDAIIQQLQAEKERAVREKDGVIQQKEQVIRENEELIQTLLDEVRQKKDHHQGVSTPPQRAPVPQEGGTDAEAVTVPKGLNWKTKVHFRRLKNLPSPMHSPQAVIYRGTLYVGGGDTRVNFSLFAYNFKPDTWDTIKTPTQFYALTVYQDHLVLAGGCLSVNLVPTDQLWLTNNQQHTLKQTIPYMISPVRNATAIGTQTHLIIAGGSIGFSQDCLAVVQVYDGGQWTRVQDLPAPTYSSPYAILNNRLYLVDNAGNVFCTYLPSLLQTQQQTRKPTTDTVWDTLPAVPSLCPSIAVLRSQLVIVSGGSGYPPTSSLHFYSDSSHTWQKMEATLPEVLSHTCSITLPTGELLVIGGYGTRYSPHVYKATLIE